MNKARNSYACKYRMAWILVMFDLPVLTAKERKEAAGFRKDLITEGFMMVQYSVYARPCPSADRVDSQVRRLRSFLPSGGEVRALTITDAQWGRMLVFFGKKPKKSENMPEQLLLFSRKKKPPPEKRVYVLKRR
jgi:CRISPR-associated protein Cas2